MIKTVIAFASFFTGFIFSAAAQRAELRAVWVATVSNIDFPSKPTISSDIQKEEFIRLADMHKSNGMNALVVQVRPATYSYYPTNY